MKNEKSEKNGKKDTSYEFPAHRRKSAPAPQIVTAEEEKRADSTLPPYPEPVLPFTEAEQKLFDEWGEVKSGDPFELRSLASKKLFALWSLYGSIVNNQRLIDLVNAPAEDRASDKYVLQSYLVNIIDQLAKVLSRGHILREIQCLQMAPEWAEDEKKE